MVQNHDPRVESLLDELLPDEKIKQDLAGILWKDGEDGSVEINEVWITIPFGCPLDITTKAYFKEYYGINFGPYKVQIAIGGALETGYGPIEAKLCFATLYYNHEYQWFTVDFYDKWR